MATHAFFKLISSHNRYIISFTAPKFLFFIKAFMTFARQLDRAGMALIGENIMFSAHIKNNIAVIDEVVE